MKIRIVTDSLTSDRILPRMSKYLSVLNGWSLSTSPEPTADFNYFVNYGTWHQKCKGWHGTPTGAYFSHLDDQNKGKEQMWYTAAEAIDVCIITAKMYGEFLPQDKVFQARAPVEMGKFTIKPLPKKDKPVVGAMGFTYGDGRKGERLFEQLTQSPLARRLYLRASGRGWTGVRCEYHEWSDIQTFFQELDVLLVPSLFEGVPMPPLEALACGVKIVVPEHIGLIDELPDVPGIYRYECGNLGAMAKAVERAAFSGPVDRDALRQVILDNYTTQHWAIDHRRIVNEYFQLEDVSNLPDWRNNAGVYVVAFGNPSRKCAKRCITSVKEHTDLPVALAADKPIDAGEDVFIQHDDADAGARVAKLKCDELAPAEWNYVLYLDADTEIVGDISFLFDILRDGWELVICKDNNKYGLVREMKRPDNWDESIETWAKMSGQEMVEYNDGVINQQTPPELMQYNGGMMAYRRNANTRRFFQKWQEEWQKYGKRDQGALLRALYDKPLRVFVLMNQFNATTRYEMPKGEIAIKHHNMEARRHNGIIHGRLDSPEAWQAVEKFNPRVKD